MTLFAAVDITDIIAALGQPVTVNGHAIMAVVDTHSVDALHAQAQGADSVLIIDASLPPALAIIGGANGSLLSIGTNNYQVRKVADEGNGFASLTLERL